VHNANEKLHKIHIETISEATECMSQEMKDNPDFATKQIIHKLFKQEGFEIFVDASLGEGTYLGCIILRILFQKKHFEQLLMLIR
jgi:hypothetical protein